MNIKHYITSIITLAMCFAPAVSSACQPPPDAWVFAGSWPQDGAQDVATESPIRLFFRDDYGITQSPLRDNLTVTVTDQETGEEIPGEFGQEDHLRITRDQRASGRIIWQPMEPFIPGRSYGVVGVFDDPNVFHGDGISEPFAFTFTVSDVVQDVRPPVVSITGLSASHGTRDLTSCIGSMYCDGTCEREAVYDTVPELRLLASVLVVEDQATGQHIIRIGTGRSAEQAQRRVGLDQSFFSRHGQVGLYRSELLSNWSSEEFCVHAEVIDGDDTVIQDVTQCMLIQPRQNESEELDNIRDPETTDRDPTDDSSRGQNIDFESEADSHGGCDVSPHGAPPSVIVWGLFALCGFFRRLRVL